MKPSRRLPSPPPPQPPSGPGPGSASGFTPMNAASGHEIKLAMQELFLTGRILATGARLAIRHTFVSAESALTEIVYTFMLPRDAALRRFRITGDGFTIRSDLKETGEAQRLYEEGIERGHLSTLAREYRDGTVNLTIGNVRPGETVTVYLELLAGVELRDDGWRFRFPFTLTPCYHAGMKAVQTGADTGELELPDQGFDDLLLPPFVRDASALHRVGFDLSVQMPEPLAEAGSPSHAIRVHTLDSRRLRVRLAPDRDIPNRDLILDVRMASSFSGVFCGTDRGGRAQFAAVIASDRLGAAGTDPRRLVFLLDRSGSMQGEPLRQARNAVLACLGALSAEDQVGCLAFDSELEPFRDTLSDTDTPTRDALRTFLEGIEARGGTELFLGLNAASRLLDQAGGDIVVLTDGQVAGTADIIGKTKALGIRIHCLGIGSASQDRFLAQLARETGGLSRFVTPRERVDAAALELFSAIGRPVATSITVTPDGLADARIEPEPAGTVFGGHPLVVYGESVPGNGRLAVAWLQDGQPRTLSLPVSADSGADAETLRLLRGARLITDLEARLGAQPDRGAAGRREATRVEQRLETLGRAYGLANRRLSLVAVVEREGDRAGALPATRVVPVGMPQDTEFEAYFSRRRMQAHLMMSVPSASTMGARESEPSIYYSVMPQRSKLPLPFAIPPTPKQPDAMDLCMDLAGRLEPDGGLPGKTDEERMCRSLIALLVLLETDQAGAFGPHIARLIGFLETTACPALPQAYRALIPFILDHARDHKPIAGPWRKLAGTLIVRGRGRLSTAWHTMQRRIKKL